MDWSMPLPMISKVLPGSFASMRPMLQPGLVLVAVNRRGLPVGEKRKEVERLLTVRPLTLLFETPCPERFGEVGVRPVWRRKPTVSEARSATSMSFFELHPERSPLSRFGCWEAHTTWKDGALQGAKSRSHSLSLQVPSTHALDLRRPSGRICKSGSAGLLALPPVLRGRDVAVGTAATWTEGFDSRWKTRRPACGDCSSGCDVLSSTLQSASAVRKPECPSWLAPSAVWPDPAYEHLFDSPRQCGPGPIAQWPLLHEDTYVCRLSDMGMASRIRDAYEVGFRGCKRERVTLMHVRCTSGAPPLRKEVTASIEHVHCDMCGITLCDDKIANPFYVCKRCKKHGNRYELCIACHATEALQGQDKYAGKELHPHYSGCTHDGLVRYSCLRAATPGRPHIRRLFCDHCGCTAAGSDIDGDVFVCPRCPEEYGVRFELCAPCALAFASRIEAIRRLR